MDRCHTPSAVVRRSKLIPSDILMYFVIGKVKIGVGGACGDASCSCDVMRWVWDGVLVSDVGELAIQVVVLHVQREHHRLTTSYWNLNHSFIRVQHDTKVHHTTISLHIYLSIMCVYYHNVQALTGWALGNDILQPISKHAARTSVFKHRSCHAEVLRVVKHGVPVEKEMASFIGQGWRGGERQGEGLKQKQ